jgi:hypothetical protein
MLYMKATAEKILTHEGSYPVTRPIAKHWLSVFAAGYEQI